MCVQNTLSTDLPHQKYTNQQFSNRIFAMKMIKNGIKYWKIMESIVFSIDTPPPKNMFCSFIS